MTTKDVDRAYVKRAVLDDLFFKAPLHKLMTGDFRSADIDLSMISEMTPALSKAATA